MLTVMQLIFQTNKLHYYLIMKKKKSFIIGLALLFSQILSACAESSSEQDNKFLATLEKPAMSPSGSYELTVIIPDEKEKWMYSFQISDKSKQVVFTPDLKFSIRSTTYWLWDENDRVWVYSGDIGTYFWEKNNSGQWVKNSYRKSNVSAPKFLKETRPRWHKK